MRTALSIVILLLTTIITSLLFTQLSHQQEQLINFLNTKESIVKQICSNLTSNHNNLLTNYPNYNDRNNCFYYNGCDPYLELKLPKYSCYFGTAATSIGFQEEKCQKQCNSRQLSLEHAITLFPTNLDGSEMYSTKNAKIIDDIRDMRCILQDMNKIYKNNKLLIDDSLTLQFIGSESSPILQSYPAMNWRIPESYLKSFDLLNSSNVCLNDDLLKSSTCLGNLEYRNRPWYIQSAFTPKNLVLMIDMSSVKIRSTDGIQITLNLINYLLESLYEQDRIVIFLFTRDIIVSPFNEKSGFLSVTNNVKLQLKSWLTSQLTVTSQSSSGATLHSKLFDTVFQFIKEYTSTLINCDTSFVMIADGETSRDDTNPKDILLNYIKETSNYNNNNTTNNELVSWNKNIRFFTFTFGVKSYAENNLLQKYPCATDGLWIPLDSISLTGTTSGSGDASSERHNDIRTVISPFFQYHTFRRINDDKVKWTGLYTDLLSKQLTASAAISCYSNDKSKFLGVVGVDVPLVLLNNYNEYVKEIERRRVVGYGLCNEQKITKDFLDNLRGGGCNYCNAPCGQTLVVIIFIPIAILAALVLFVVLFIWHRIVQRRQDNGDEEDVKKQMIPPIRIPVPTMNNDAPHSNEAPNTSRRSKRYHHHNRNETNDGL
ncbi:hypothetical protein ABK040_009573 [Willaertia magna]